MLAVSVLIIFSLLLVTLASYAVSNSHHASGSKARQIAFSLAEAGINNAVSVLWVPTNNALNPNLLGSQQSPVVQPYDGGTVSWYGTFDQPTATWKITSTGSVVNPNKANAKPVRVTLSARVPVTASYTAPANSQIWNYIYVRRTGNTCDQSLNNAVDMGSPMYVEGNLCLNTPSQISAGPLVVKGTVTLDSNTNIGTSSNPINEAHIVGGCKYKNFPLHNPCQGPPGNADKLWADTIDTVPPAFSPPVPKWDEWYANASPGPNFPCYAPLSSGTTPTFDTGDGIRNNSVSPAWNLTPATSYDCWTAGGQLTWDAGAKLLTVKGTVFIDGSAYIENMDLVRYTGQATLYLSGTFLLKTSKLCASAQGSNCNYQSWNPNQALLLIVANGNGDNGIPVGDGAQLVSAELQGGLWTTHAIELDTYSTTDGPMDAGTVIIGQTLTTHSWPLITELPAGAPGNPNVYAQPGRPVDYSG